jgi:hypothetical protein
MILTLHIISFLHLIQENIETFEKILEENEQHLAFHYDEE